MFLVALALPGVRVARDGSRSPHAPDGHAVVVDADVAPRRTEGVGALPAVRRVAEQVSRPAGSVLEVAGLAQVTLIQRAGIAGGVRSGRRREHRTDGNRTHREGGRDSPFQRHSHLWHSLLETPRNFLGHLKV